MSTTGADIHADLETQTGDTNRLSVDKKVKDLGVLLLGWLLGVLSPVMASLVGRPFERAALKKTLSSELHDIRFRLSANVFLIADRLGTFDRDLLRWARAAMSDSRGQGEQVENIRMALDSLLASDAAALNETIRLRQQQTEQQRLQASLSVKRILHPVMDASAAALRSRRHPERLCNSIEPS